MKCGVDENNCHEKHKCMDDGLHHMYGWYWSDICNL